MPRKTQRDKKEATRPGRPRGSREPAAPEGVPARRVEDLQARLAKAEEALAAIRSGAVDALAVSEPAGERIYTLSGAEKAYRVLIEAMGAGVFQGAEIERRRVEARSPGLGKIPNVLVRLLVLLGLHLVFAAPVLLAGCDRGPARPGAGGGKKITVAVTPWPGSVPIYIAQEKGYFRDEGLDAALHPYESGHLGLAAVLSGGADFATAGETPIARAAVDGKPVMVVATVAEIDRAILIIARRDRGIKAADDLGSKTIGRVAGTTADFFLDIYLTTAHVDPKEVRIVDLPPDRVVQALVDGNVDAVSTWAPHTTTLRDRLGGNAVVLHEPGLYTMTWNVVAAKELARRDPDGVARFLRAIARADRLIAERPAEARAMAVRVFGPAGASVEREWSSCRFDTRLDQSLLLYLEDQARWMIRKEAGLREMPNFMDHVFMKPLKAVEPEAVRIVGE